MNTLPDLSQLTHEQLLEFTRQLALQHQSLAQSNQQLDAKVQHLSILNQKYEHELALFKKHKFGRIKGGKISGRKLLDFCLFVY